MVADDAPNLGHGRVLRDRQGLCRVGAGGTLGTGNVAKAAPDGYTILLGSVATHAIAAGVYPKLTYDPVASFAPISQLTRGPLVLAVAPQVVAKTVAELIAPAGTPPGIVQQLNTAAVAALKDESVQKSLATLGDESVGSSVADFTGFVRAEHQRWVQIIRSGGIKID